MCSEGPPDAVLAVIVIVCTEVAYAAIRRTRLKRPKRVAAKESAGITRAVDGTNQRIDAINATSRLRLASGVWRLASGVENAGRRAYSEPKSSVRPRQELNLRHPV